MRVTPADILFDIADLSAVWILADVYESDLATVELGMAAEVTLPYQPGRTWRGKVAFVNPIVDPGTRTVKVRIEVANEDYALKPDMFADVVLRRELGDALFVPESAVLKPGDRQIVFLDLGDGRLAPREIETGARVEGGYAVLSGIAEGDKVVTSANFLIDSESSLKAVLSSMGAAPPAGGPHAGHAPGHARTGTRRQPRPGHAAKGPVHAPAEGRRLRLPDAPGGDVRQAGLLPHLRHGPRTPEAAMTRAIIKWSAENRWVVLLATAALVLFAVYTLRTIPVDAIPDLSDTQVIVYSRWDRSPDIVEDQVTYPIVTALLGAPKVKTIRGFSDFGYSYVYVIFEDGTDIYWARSRVVEYLSKIQPAPARGRAHRDGPGRHRRRLGLPVRPRGRLGKAQPRRPAHVPGLDAALPPAVRAGRRRGGHLRRLPAAVPGHGRPEPAQGLRPRDHGGHRGGAPRQRRGGRPARRDVGQGVHGPRPGLRPLDGRPREDRPARRPARDAGARSATWPRWRSAPRSAAGSATSTASATPWAGSWSCATARTRAP